MYKLPAEFDIYNTLGGGFPMMVSKWEDFTEVFELIETPDLLPVLNIDHYLN